MNRKEFIKKSLLGVAAGVGLTLAGKAKEVKPYKSGSDIGVSYSYPSDNPNDYVEISEQLFSHLLKSFPNSIICGWRVSLTQLHLIPDNTVLKGCYFDVWPNGGLECSQSRELPRMMESCYINCTQRGERAIIGIIR